LREISNSRHNAAIFSLCQPSRETHRLVHLG
jgi:hypothetical protein